MDDTIWSVFPLLLAPFIGSFLGVVILRLPAGRELVWSRSCCESCGQTLAARDMVPLLSFAVLRGRCRVCRARIGLFHPAIELAALGVAASALWADPDRVWADCLLGWTLLALACIDWTHLRLPDVLTLPLIPAGLAEAWWEGSALALDHAVASLLAYALFRAVALGYRALRGRDGLGMGDAKLLAVAGAWVGVGGLAPVLFGGAVLGIGLVLVSSVRHGREQVHNQVPFGPALAVALWCVRLSGG